VNKLTTASAIAVLTFGSSHAMAADFSYSYFDGGAILADTPGSDGKGLGIALSTELTQLYPNATAFTSLRFVDFDGFNVLNAEAGLGVHFPLMSVLDLNAGAGLALGRAKGLAGGDTEVGLALNAGVRAHPFSPRWELDAGLKHVDIGTGQDTYVQLGGRFAFNPRMSAGIQLESGDVDFWTASLRWER
jgi:hypothetical protein